MFPYCRMPTHITGLYIFTVVNFLVLFHVTVVQADVFVKFASSNRTLAQFLDLPASFGKPLPWDGLRGFLVNSDPLDACTHVALAPNKTLSWILLARRGTCNFAQKVRNAQDSGFSAVIVYNDRTDQLETMNADARLFAQNSSLSNSTSHGTLIRTEHDELIPSVFVGISDGEELLTTYTYEKRMRYFILIDRHIPQPSSIVGYLIAFASVMGLVFLATITTLIVRYIKDLRQRRRHQLSPQHLKRLPVKKFEKGDIHYDTCAICLEDYAEGDKLRILPCAHAYHLKCIDPWLTKSKRTCPVCKRKVFPNIDTSDSEEDSDDDVRAPLLQHQGNRPTTSGNTFGPPPLPSFLSFLEDNHDHENPAVSTEDEDEEMVGAVAALPPVSLGRSINMDEDDINVHNVVVQVNDPRTTRRSKKRAAADNPIQIGVEATAATSAAAGMQGNERVTTSGKKDNVLVI